MEKNSKKKIPNKVKSNSKKQKDKVIKEIGGPKGPEPTRYGDWEVKGRVSDF